MPAIDMYLRSLERFGATGVELTSGANVKLKFPSGDRFATQTTAHDHLVQLVGEIAPAADRVSVSSGTPIRFPYSSGGNSYEVRVEPSGAEWVVMVVPAQAAPVAMPPAVPVAMPPAVPVAMPPAVPAPPPQAASVVAAPAPAPEPVDSIPIERHQYNIPAPTPAPTPTPTPAPTSAPAVVRVPSPAAVPAGVAGLIDKLLFRCKDIGASDLHLCTGSPPLIRVDGEIHPLEGFEVFTPESLEAELRAITPEDGQAEFDNRNDADFAYAVPNLSRFRVNLFRDRKGVGAVLRAIPFEIPTAKQLGVPEKVLDLCNLSKGLVLVTGPTGSGKSTTLAALIDHINRTRNTHIITIEDPIEFVHENKTALINQREVKNHTLSFKSALRAALREDPDIVLVGEMRDLETIEIAVETAETGHLVFGTLHTSTAPSTVDRIIDQFPTDRQEQVRTMLSGSLQGVIAQVLCKKIGGGRVAAHEILLGSSAVANLIREKKTFQLFSIMQTGRKQGMQTMNDALMALVKTKKVEPMEAYIKAVNKVEMKNLLARAGFEF